MISQMKTVLKKTPLYPAILARRTRRWTEHDRAAQSFYRQFLSPGDLVFDVGANLGTRSKVFLALGCKVVAIEPQKFCVAVLQRAFGRKLTIIQCALSDQPGEALLQVGEDTVLATLSAEWIETVKQSGRFGKNPWTGVVHVKTLTADNLIQRYGVPRFMKIDVEGHELSVLQGLSNPVWVISIEFTAETLSTAQACLDQICRLGIYEFNYSEGESMVFAHNQWCAKESLLDELCRKSRTNADLWGDIYARVQR